MISVLSTSKENNVSGLSSMKQASLVERCLGTAIFYHSGITLASPQSVHSNHWNTFNDNLF
jgi:hypothetical protein